MVEDLIDKKRMFPVDRVVGNQRLSFAEKEGLEGVGGRCVS
jgi:hypothetical protein